MLWTVDQQNRNKISLGFYYLILSLAIRRQVGDKFQSSEIKKGRQVLISEYLLSVSADRTSKVQSLKAQKN